MNRKPSFNDSKLTRLARAHQNKSRSEDQRRQPGFGHWVVKRYHVISGTVSHITSHLLSYFADHEARRPKPKASARPGSASALSRFYVTDVSGRDDPACPLVVR
ncbi:hypothetical protein HPP92_008045 [Vanilla planifolia]|uniref:Uncharacterized protein n=1 Tax=Vanilla planifolia TaxID=51239 RepID=A0A835VA64_VANPL|nr:hypothetical protein HPP92_008045 [Vanilla planifolia]